MAMKLFGLSLLASYAATSALGPATLNSHLNVRGMVPQSLRFDSIDAARGRMVGADLMAGTCLYMCLCSGGWYLPAAAFALFDVCYYGPMGVAMPASAAVACLTLL